MKINAKLPHRQPWFNDRIKQELVLRRRLECKWLIDQTEYNFQAFLLPKVACIKCYKDSQETILH